MPAVPFSCFFFFLVRPGSVLQCPPRHVPALVAAAAKGDLDVVRELLRLGADPRETAARPPVTGGGDAADAHAAARRWGRPAPLLQSHVLLLFAI